jgi:GntR family transcriptional regulator, galactonate operon transcriptional repressor
LYYNTIIQYDCMTNIGAMAKAFTSLQRQNLPEQVVRQIGLSIMRNDFKPGDALLSEPELSLQFNVSRPVLREALKMLGAKGLIESRPKTGTRVRPRAEWNLLDPDVIAWQYEIGFDRSFLQAICEIRLMFEPMTAKYAATRATAEEVAWIEHCCQRLQDTVDSNEDYIPEDLQFHTAICSAAHNELLQKILATLDTPLRASRVITSQLPDANQNAMPLHWVITRAICSRDEKAAEAAMQKLVMLTTDDIQRALNVDRMRKKGGCWIGLNFWNPRRFP